MSAPRQIVFKPPALAATISSTRAAQVLGCSPDTLDRLREIGVVNAFRWTPRGFWHYDRASVIAYRDHLRRGGEIEEYLELLRRRP